MSELSVEPVRLVIWDLDETFWKGTLSEGGITFCPRNRDIVIALAERGIISTICSKNDLEPVRDILKEHEVWDYFVFPSVNWGSKGPRLQALERGYPAPPRNRPADRRHPDEPQRGAVLRAGYAGRRRDGHPRAAVDPAVQGQGRSRAAPPAAVQAAREAQGRRDRGGR